MVVLWQCVATCALSMIGFEVLQMLLLKQLVIT